MPLLPSQPEIHMLPSNTRYCGHEALRKRPDSPEEEVRGQTLRDEWTDWQALGDAVETAQRRRIHYAIRKKEIRRGIFHLSKDSLGGCDDARNTKQIGVSSDIADSIGNTPIVSLRKIVPKGSARILAKLELANPTDLFRDI